MKQLKISLFIFLVFSINLVGQNKKQSIKIKDSIEYEVWTTMNALTETGEETHLQINYNIIKHLPLEMKVLIARYTTFFPDYILDRIDKKELAKSFGNFASLEEAQLKLSKEWSKKIFVPKYYLSYLTIKRIKSEFRIEYISSWNNETEKYILTKKKGKVTYIKNNSELTKQETNFKLNN